MLRRTKLPRRIWMETIAGIIGAGLLVGLAACNFIPPGAAGSIATPLPTATFAPTIIYQNPLTSVASGWPSTAGACFLGPDGYHITNNYVCPVPVGPLAAVDISVQVKQISGPLANPYGITFRSSQTTGYEFDIAGTGEWRVLACGNGQKCNPLIAPTTDAAITKGLNVPNILEARAAGTHLDFLVNGTKVGQADDQTITAAGTVGLAVSRDIECVFTSITVTKLG